MAVKLFLKLNMNKKTLRKAVFLDRDGVINKRPPEHNYIKKWEDFKFLPNVAKAIRELNRNFLVIIVTNQRGITRGMMTVNDLEDIHKKMRAEFKKENARIDGIYFCPHNIEDNCQCRKPKPGMLFKASKDFKIDLRKSYMIGDDFTDIEAGREAGCKTILINNQETKIYPNYIVSNLLEAARIISPLNSFFYFFKIFKNIEKFLSGRGLRRIPGVNILYKRLWFPFSGFLFDKSKFKRITLINVQGNKMYLNTNDRSIAPVLLTEKGIEKYQTKLFKKMVNEGMVVVDIGARIGYYTLIGAKLVGKEGIVYAFEPEPNNYKFLCKNIKINSYPKVISLQKAISNKKGKSKLWFDKIILPCSSFSEENASVFSKGHFLEKDNFVEVETITLDEFFRDTKIDVIKMDIQGAEGLAIEGAKKILRNNNDLKILMEFWPDGLKSLGTNP